MAPLSTPIETDAFLAPDAGDWRVVIFPGTPCNKLQYLRFLRTAPKGVEIVVITRPGFGKGHRQAITPFEEQVMAIKPFLPGGKWGDKNVVTMGVSYGGELALKAAVDFPDKIKGVVTVSALIDEPHDYLLKLEKLAGEDDAQRFVPNAWKKTRAEIVGRRGQIGPLLKQLETLTVPVVVLHGDFDAMAPKSNADKLMKFLGPETQAELEIVPGGIHFMEFQFARRIHAAIERVIERSL